MLCDLAVKEGVLKPNRVRKESYAGQTQFYYADNLGTLPTTVKEWAGLRTEEGSFNTPTWGYSSLASMNDNGFTFEHIATLIESKPDKLFR